MKTKITAENLKNHFKCTYKTYLTLKGKYGEQNEFQEFLEKKEAEYRLRSIDILNSKINSNKYSSQELDIKKLNHQEYTLYSNVYLKSDEFEIKFDSLAYDSRENLWIPVCYTAKENINIQDKILLAAYCFFLKERNNTIPPRGRIIYSNEYKSISVKTTSLIPKAEKMIKEISLIRDSLLKPEMFLNKNCDLCEFKNKCKSIAEKNDSLCLIRGITRKEIDKLHNKGIFTVTQCSYTFRPRRRRTINKKIKPFKPELKALSIRENKIHVYDLPEIKTDTISIFLDVEGMLNNSFYYLIGVIIIDDKIQEHYSFWADSKKEEILIFEKFLGVLDRYESFVIYHYGSYESRYFKKMLSQYSSKSKQAAEAKLKNSCNLLALLYSNIYFPTYTNGLKEIANHLGFSWSERNASGMQSILWRERWDESKDDKVKGKLVQYNYEDCLALFHLKNTVIRNTRL